MSLSAGRKFNSSNLSEELIIGPWVYLVTVMIHIRKITKGDGKKTLFKSLLQPKCRRKTGLIRAYEPFWASYIMVPGNAFRNI